jgi:hypothetical protein
MIQKDLNRAYSDVMLYDFRPFRFSAAAKGRTRRRTAWNHAVVPCGCSSLRYLDFILS